MLFLGLSAEALTVLAGGALVAGWVDAVVGGGGMILIPLIMAVAPELAPAVAVATNKVAVICGTGSAAVTLMRKARPSVHLLRYYLPVAVICAMAGAAMTSLVPAEVMRPLVIVLMLAAGLVVAANPSLGRETSAPLARACAPAPRTRRAAGGRGGHGRLPLLAAVGLTGRARSARPPRAAHIRFFVRPVAVADHGSSGHGCFG